MKICIEHDSIAVVYAIFRNEYSPNKEAIHKRDFVRLKISVSDKFQLHRLFC